MSDATGRSAGDGDPRTLSSSLELVRSCTMSACTPGDLRTDIGGADLGIRLRGEVTLLATQVSLRGAEQLFARLGVVLATGARITARQLEVLDACADHLGLAPDRLPTLDAARRAVAVGDGRRPRGHQARRSPARHRSARRHATRGRMR